MPSRRRRALWAGLALLGLPWLGSRALADEHPVLIEPQATDPRLAAGEAPHWVLYDRAQVQPLLVWLPGTGGHPTGGPQALFRAVRAEGYRVLALSYRTTPAVAQACTPAHVRVRPACAEAFRQQRVWGDAGDASIDDGPADAIVSRLTALLRTLARQDPQGHWDEALGVPTPNQHPLDLPVRGAGAHGEGIGNPAYEPLWRAMLRALRPR